MVADGNIFAGIAAPGAEEEITAFVDNATVRIERIVSHGQASPPDSGTIRTGPNS